MSKPSVVTVLPHAVILKFIPGRRGHRADTLMMFELTVVLMVAGGLGGPCPTPSESSGGGEGRLMMAVVIC